ncbi:MAG: 4-diphosphocytidyl-2-C-methyl-D-erythritol kinase [Hyphomicrobiales bacterium]|nr:4-diphosphocytidyl-2-C-methyl-D-erythritol kinase [Hyphomicrobiales bacterium]
MPSARAVRAEFAPAKVNLTLHVIGRRPDGYHEIESLVVFADVGDRLTFSPGGALELVVRGPTAAAAGPEGGNLVLKAARRLAERVEGLELGRFTLDKRLPVAAGLGGGSSDAAAALRLLARHNDIALEDPRVHEAARLTGADVPVCLDPRARMMCGIGERLSAPMTITSLPAVLVNPGVSLPTKDVFEKLAARASAAPHDPLSLLSSPAGQDGKRGRFDMTSLSDARNDLEPPAIALQPVIAETLSALRAAAKCRLARMSGSGATCFALFESGRAATAAARTLRANHPHWWVRAATFGP